MLLLSYVVQPCGVAIDSPFRGNKFYPWALGYTEAWKGPIGQEWPIGLVLAIGTEKEPPAWVMKVPLLECHSACPEDQTPAATIGAGPRGTLPNWTMKGEDTSSGQNSLMRCRRHQATLWTRDCALHRSFQPRLESLRHQQRLW